MDYNISKVLSLISHIHASSQDFTNQKLSSKNGLVSSHGFILFLLKENKYMAMSDISKAINRDKSTTTVLIRKLKDLGLVKETQCNDDSRKKFISLTEKGMEMNDFTSGISQELLEVCYKDFSTEEKNTLLTLLKKMSYNIDNSLK